MVFKIKYWPSGSDSVPLVEYSGCADKDEYGYNGEEKEPVRKGNRIMVVQSLVCSFGEDTDTQQFQSYGI